MLMQLNVYGSSIIKLEKTTTVLKTKQNKKYVVESILKTTSQVAF